MQHFFSFPGLVPISHRLMFAHRRTISGSATLGAWVTSRAAPRVLGTYDVAVAFEPGLRFFAQTERQKRAKEVAADRLAALARDRPCLRQRLYRAEYLFHHPQMLAAQRRLASRELEIPRLIPLAWA